MTTIDLRPFYRTVREFDRLASRLVASVTAVDTGPAFDILETGADRYAVHLAVPGWRRDELAITVENGVLVVRGEPAPEKSEARWIQRGISRQPFERRFALAEHVEVKGARLENGLLVIELARELPEALKPRVIPIATETSGLAAAA
ncbi:MAG: Hsp20 family protein [Geminicoccaceae bacterium]|nr:Hsp20 family protein [Geminicoccaceae bacterium]MCS7268342.1 Hsp20 family protein [Geminicoccaceae bacterium]MCX7629228.1 Hsp20 family protein [Geminicoccaceae bacterium]MDW8124607.1 Hsp20 family protein [Geminicoccaceae bacterium]MDW8341293.1 Hsp20 family protein [Geminicoccaceae bacterium]